MYRPRDASSKGHIIQETYDPRKYLRGRYLQGASSEGEEGLQKRSALV